MLTIAADQRTEGFKRCIIKAALLLLLSSLKHNLNLAEAQYFTGPTSMAIGNSGVAGLKSPEATFLNPAALTETEGFNSSLMYQDGVVQSGERRTLTGLLITDNTEGVFLPGALAYLQGSRRFAGVSAEEQMWRVSFAKKIHTRWGLGFGLTHLTSEVQNDKSYKQLGAQLGAQFQATQAVSLGLAFENLGSDEKEVPLAFRLIPQTRVGMSYRPTELFALFVEAARRERENDDKKGSLHLGLESYPNAFTVVRTGMKWDDFAAQNFFTFGLGFDGPRLKINYAFQKAIKGTHEALHGVDFLVAF